MRSLESASAAVERTWEMRLGGRPMATADRYEVGDPATGRRLTEAPDFSPGEVDRVVRAATKAQRTWGEEPARACAGKVYEFAGSLRALVRRPLIRRTGFGPVLSAPTFQNEAEPIEIANRTECGLTAGLWTSDITRAHRMAAQLDAGYVGVNGGSQHYWAFPSAGLKASGVGREESLDELLTCTETKAVTVVLT